MAESTQVPADLRLRLAQEGRTVPQEGCVHVPIAQGSQALRLASSIQLLLDLPTGTLRAVVAACMLELDKRGWERGK